MDKGKRDATKCTHFELQEQREIGVADAAPLRGSAGGDEC